MQKKKHSIQNRMGWVMLRAYDWCLKFLYSVRAKQKRNSLFKRKSMQQQQQLSCNKCVCFYFYIFIVKSFENIFIFLVSLSLQIQLFHHWENVLMKCFDFWNLNMEFRILISVFVRVCVWALMFFFLSKFAYVHEFIFLFCERVKDTTASTYLKNNKIDDGVTFELKQNINITINEEEEKKNVKKCLNCRLHFE